MLGQLMNNTTSLINIYIKVKFEYVQPFSFDDDDFPITQIFFKQKDVCFGLLYF